MKFKVQQEGIESQLSLIVSFRNFCCISFYLLTGLIFSRIDVKAFLHLLNSKDLFHQFYCLI